MSLEGLERLERIEDSKIRAHVAEVSAWNVKALSVSTYSSSQFFCNSIRWGFRLCVDFWLGNSGLANLGIVLICVAYFRVFWSPRLAPTAALPGARGVVELPRAAGSAPCGAAAGPQPLPRGARAGRGRSAHDLHSFITY